MLLPNDKLLVTLALTSSGSLAVLVNVIVVRPDQKIVREAPVSVPRLLSNSPNIPVWSMSVTVSAIGLPNSKERFWATLVPARTREMPMPDR